MIVIAFVATNCTASENSLQNDGHQNNSIDAESQRYVDKSDSLSPFFVFNANKLYVVDYSKRKIATPRTGYFITERYIVNWGSSNIFRTTTQDEYKTLDIDCPNIGSVYPFDNYFLNLCQGANFQKNEMQLYDIRDNLLVGSYDFNVGGNYVEYFLWITSSPDYKYFLAYDPSNEAKRIFSVDPLQPMPINEEIRIVGDVFSSPDRNYLIVGNSGRETLLLKWNDGELEVIERIEFPSKLLATSSDAQQLVIQSKNSNNEDEVLVIDRNTGEVIYRYPAMDLLYGGFFPDYAALAHDGSYLFISGEAGYSENDGDYYVLMIDVASGKFINNFGPYNDGIPFALRIEYLPDSIRNTWDWEDY